MSTGPANSPSAAHEDAVTARIGALLHSLGPAEKQVAQAILAHAEQIPDLSTQGLADLSGTSRASVVRACQTFGYTGFQQLRILMARDSTLARPHAAGGEVPGSPIQAMGTLVADLAGAASLLDAAQLEASIGDLGAAPRILVASGGLSAPVGADAAARLLRLGCTVLAPSDPLEAEIAASLLGPGDACLVISASGTNAEAVRTARRAAARGAQVIALVAALGTPLEEIATRTHAVAVPPRPVVEDLAIPTRLALHLLVEALAASLAVGLGESGISASVRTLEAASDHVHE
ncbi:MurR/RpiR family transcriptional regulator [Brachybacterium sp. DNPG3]